MHAKAEHPANYLDHKKVPPLIELYFEVNRLKSLFRQGWLERGIQKNHCESVADHSFGVALFAMLIADEYCPELDLLKLVRIALIHDLGEVYAGDLTPADGVAPSEKYQLEKQAVKRLFGKHTHGEEYLALWEDYEKGQSPEARFVREIDRLEMCMQADVYQHLTGKDLNEFFNSAAKTVQHPDLQRLFRELRRNSAKVS